MASVIVLTMEPGGHAPELGALRALGHELELVEPRWPECKTRLTGLRPALVVVDGQQAPSHGRAAARWLAGQPRLRTVPFLFVDVVDRDVAKVKKEVPRAQFATWSSLSGAGDRLIKAR